jgi:hypothetical protein
MSSRPFGSLAYCPSRSAITSSGREYDPGILLLVDHDQPETTHISPPIEQRSGHELDTDQKIGMVEAAEPDATSILAPKPDFEQRLADDVLTYGHQVEVPGCDLATSIELDGATAHDDGTRHPTLLREIEGAREQAQRLKILLAVHSASPQRPLGRLPPHLTPWSAF